MEVREMFMLMVRFGMVALVGCLLGGCHHVTPYRAGGPQEDYPLVQRPATTALTGALARFADAPAPRTKPLQVLAITVGGMDSAFVAGALVGWSDAGTRPTFDVATGTSSGALVATFALLGPKYDSKLQRLFTTVSSSDLYRVRPAIYLPLDRSLASAKPFEKLLEKELDEAFFVDLREAHAQGRRLFVGTTNIETRRPVVWDIGAIASSGRPGSEALVRKILLAAATWPGYLPPVEFEVEVDGQCRREQHIDGGASAQCFVRFGPTPGWPIQDEAAPGWLAGSDLYIIAGARLYDAPTPVKAKLVDRTLTGVSCMIGSRARADMLHLHTLCMTSGMRYHLLGMPRELTGSQKSVVEINPTEMRRLFNAGHRLTCMGPDWRHTPPGSEAGEEEVPRGAAPNMICR